MEKMYVGIFMSGGCACVAPSGEWLMLRAVSGRIHLSWAELRGLCDYRLVLKNTKVFFKVKKILDIQQIFTHSITAIRHGELKTRSPVLVPCLPT